MTTIRGNTGEIHEPARYEVRPEALEQCLAAIQEFLEYKQVDANAAFQRI